MVIFIDESGIHKQTGHSTASVVYVEVENLEKFESKLKKLDNDRMQIAIINNQNIVERILLICSM